MDVMTAELLTPEEVGKVLRVSDQTVVAMCKKEELEQHPSRKAISDLHRATGRQVGVDA